MMYGPFQFRACNFDIGDSDFRIFVDGWIHDDDNTNAVLFAETILIKKSIICH